MPFTCDRVLRRVVAGFACVAAADSEIRECLSRLERFLAVKSGRQPLALEQGMALRNPILAFLEIGPMRTLEADSFASPLMPSSDRSVLRRDGRLTGIVDTEVLLSPSSNGFAHLWVDERCVAWSIGERSSAFLAWKQSYL
jgi:hypothetical protein